jgi:hypothetical protein
VLDDDPFFEVRMLYQERFNNFTVTHQNDCTIELTDGKGRSLDHRLGSIVPPHGINCDLHD